jgi:DNA-binding response OmpR family regulator
VKGRAKILIIDDDPDILRLLQVTLESVGFSPLLAGDGQTALRRIDSEHPDVVLLDVMMPVVDGWGVLEDLEGMPNPPRVIVVSAKTGELDRARAFRLGAAEYLTKPFVIDDLIDVIHAVLARTEEEGDLRRREALVALGDESGQG